MKEDLADDAVELGLATASGANPNHIVAVFQIASVRRLQQGGATVTASYTLYVQPNASYDPATAHAKLVAMDEAGLNSHIDKAMATMNLDDSYSLDVQSFPDPKITSVKSKLSSAMGSANARTVLKMVLALVFIYHPFP